LCSLSNGDCIELARLAGDPIVVRDSKNPKVPHSGSLSALADVMPMTLHADGCRCYAAGRENPRPI
jgi:Domain of unknown function (DUF397)